MSEIIYSPMEVRLLTYGLYVSDWMNNHDEGMPVSFNEFVDNEYMECVDYIRGLLIDNGLGDWVESYNLDY